MSHNVLKVNNSNSSNNNINLNLSDLCSVSNIQTNDIIKHNGTNFVNSTASGGGSFTYSDVYYNKRFHWHSDAGGSNHPNGSFHSGTAYNNAYQNGDYWVGGLKRSTWQNYKHIDSSVSENESTTSNTAIENRHYIESFNIGTAGNYLCIYSVQANSATTISFRWQSNAGFFGAKTSMTGNKGNGYGANVIGIVNASQNDTLRLVISDLSGSGTNWDQMRSDSAYHNYCDQLTILKLP